jgi:predicted nucleotidyltransferase
LALEDTHSVMPNADSNWRIEIARKIAPIYTAYPDVAALVLIGGIARGRGDIFSDIDLTAYWSRPPTEDERRAAQAQYAAILHTPVVTGELYQHAISDYPGAAAYMYEEAAYIGGDERTGFKIDVTHDLAEVMDWVIEQVTQQHDAHGARLERLYSIQRVIVFKGEALIREWQARARLYPRALSVKLVEMHLRQLRFDVAMHLHRGDLLLFYQALTTVGYHLMGALLALNRVYRPELKRLADLCGELALKPDDLAGRLNRMLRDAPERAARDFDDLTEEVFRLIAAELSEVDLTTILKPYYVRRQAYRGSPIE